MLLLYILCPGTVLPKRSPQIGADNLPLIYGNLWPSFLGSKLIFTTSYNPKANELVERFHRVLEAALKAQLNPGDWYSNLGWILLSLHVTFVDHFSHCLEEILFGCPLCLPGEFFEPNKQFLSENTYVQNLKILMEQLTATPIRTRSAQKTYVSNALFQLPTFSSKKMANACLFKALTAAPSKLKNT